MKLAEWMAQAGETDQSFAEKVKRSRTRVQRWRSRVARPDWEALKEIERVTDGLVTPQDFYDLAEPAQ